MRTKGWRLLAATVVAGALLAGGCGGGTDDHAAYVEKVNAVGQTLQQQLSSLSKSIATQSDPRGIADNLDDGAAALDAAAGDLARTRTGDDAKRANADIVAGIRHLADTFTTAARQARAGKLDALRRTFSRIGGDAGLEQIAKATRALKDAGYEIG